jgi:hypothetical protein
MFTHIHFFARTGGCFFSRSKGNESRGQLLGMRFTVHELGTVTSSTSTLYNTQGEDA